MSTTAVGTPSQPAPPNPGSSTTTEIDGNTTIVAPDGTQTAVVGGGSPGIGDTPSGTGAGTIGQNGYVDRTIAQEIAARHRAAQIEAIIGRVIGGPSGPTAQGAPGKDGTKPGWTPGDPCSMYQCQQGASSCWPSGGISSPPSKLPPVPGAPGKPGQSSPAQGVPGQTPNQTSSVYTVRRGDTLSGIAARYGTTWQQVYAANRGKINDPNLIYPGQRLHIPISGGTTQGPPTKIPAPDATWSPGQLPPTKVPPTKSGPPTTLPPTKDGPPTKGEPPTKLPPTKLPPEPPTSEPPTTTPTPSTPNPPHSGPSEPGTPPPPPSGTGSGNQPTPPSS